jgi:hypothetical protein
MKIAYYDTNVANMFEHSVGPDGNTYHLVPHDRQIRFREILVELGVDVRYTIDYTDPGVYIVHVNGAPWWWLIKCGNILEVLGEHVKEGMRAGLLQLVIDASLEGNSMIQEKPDLDNSLVYNGFEIMHETCQRMDIPLHKVTVLHGSFDTNQKYYDWCLKTETPSLITFKYSCPWDDTPRQFMQSAIEEPLILSSLESKDPKDYNSLNRIEKLSRYEHFYQLIHYNILEKGLVSGNIDHIDRYHTVRFCSTWDDEDFRDTVKKHFPRCTDGKNLGMLNPVHDVPISTYKNSLLTFVTETHFVQPCQFISEKIFKPLAAGHPFLVLGTPGTLKILESIGYETDMLGFGTDYDEIEDPRERFKAVHHLLKKWCDYSLDKKRLKIRDSLEKIKYNFNRYRELDYRKKCINDIFE